MARHSRSSWVKWIECAAHHTDAHCLLQDTAPRLPEQSAGLNWVSVDIPGDLVDIRAGLTPGYKKNCHHRCCGLSVTSESMNFIINVYYEQNQKSRHD